MIFSLSLWSGSFNKSVTIDFKHSVQGLTASVGNQLQEFRSGAFKHIGVCMFCDIVVSLLNLMAIGVVAVWAFLEKERGDQYRQKYLDAMNRLMELECQREHE